MRDTRASRLQKKNIGFARWQIHLGTVFGKRRIDRNFITGARLGPRFWNQFWCSFPSHFLYLYYSRPQIGDLKND